MCDIIVSKRIKKNKGDTRKFKYCDFCHNPEKVEDCGIVVKRDGKRVWECNGCIEYDRKRDEENKKPKLEVVHCDFVYTPGDPYW